MRGDLTIVAPSLLYLEMLNVAARRWRWSPRRVSELAARLLRYRFAVAEPSLERVAFWTNKGLSAYDACYLAVAEQRKSVLLTTDKQLLEVGGRWVRPL